MFVYNSTARPNKDEENDVQGYVWAFLVYGLLMGWAVGGEVGTLLILVEQVRIAGTLSPSVLTLLAWLVAALGILGLVFVGHKIYYKIEEDAKSVDEALEKRREALKNMKGVLNGVISDLAKGSPTKEAVRQQLFEVEGSLRSHLNSLEKELQTLKDEEKKDKEKKGKREAEASDDAQPDDMVLSLDYLFAKADNVMKFEFAKYDLIDIARILITMSKTFDELKVLATSAEVIVGVQTMCEALLKSLADIVARETKTEIRTTERGKSESVTTALGLGLVDIPAFDLPARKPAGRISAF